jgi:parallel beta-helix repeat protein
LTIDCNKAGQTDGGSDYSQNGIYGVVATKDILVENCIVKNAYKEGIIFMASVGHSANHTNVRILNNNIIGCRIASECMYDSQVIGNYITGANTAGAIEIFGDHRNLTISGNHIINPANDGIQLYVDNTNLASSSTNNVITGNVIQNAGHHGIYILGMRLRYDVISNNAIYMAAYVPIAVYQATYISITDNMIDHYGSGMTYGYGILLENVNYSTVQGNSIYCLDATCLPWGILLSGSSHNSVVGNSITSILGGIGFQTGTAGSHSTNNTIMGNVLGQGLEVDAMDDGIYEYDANQNYNYVIGNSVKAGTAITLNGAQSVKANNIEL